MVMRNRIFIIFVTVLNSTFCFSQVKLGRNIDFDTDWRFKKGNYTDAKAVDFNDSEWRKLDVPHDWSIEDLTETPSDSITGPFSIHSAGKNASAFTVGGTAWYRKTFTMDKSTANKKVLIQFDGVYMIADVWVNGHHLGTNYYGYTTFLHDLTPYLNPVGQKNVIAVQVKNDGDNSRWYAGSGIYRHVWLHVINPTHIANWGVQVLTNNGFQNQAEIKISTKTVNVTGTISLLTEIYSSDNKLVSSSISQVLQDQEVEQTILLKNPKLWNTDSPFLYKAKLSLKRNGKIIDQYEQNFGIRSIQFDASTGFTLNGKNIKLKGGNIHHDNGPLGAMAIDRAEERKIELLKKNGYNAVRFSHNPPSPYILDVCDRLGMLVVDEAFDMWNVSKSPDDYSKFFKENWRKDLETMVVRDRNHPSIIIWSIGNEIPEIADTLGYQTSNQLANHVRLLDTTRPITNAIPIFVGFQKGKNWDMTAPSFAALDIAGYNYASSFYEKDHLKFPKRVMMGTETFPPLALDNWNAVEKNPFVIGMFSWAAIDYLGEAGLALARTRDRKEKAPNFQTDFTGSHWPIFHSYSGELDLIGNKKTSSYYLDVVWRRSPIEMVVHRPLPPNMKEYTSYWGFPDEYKSWTFPGHENDTLQIRVFTRCKRVQLELNGKIVGEQTVPQNSITATFAIPYVKGHLVARCFDSEKEVAKQTLSTTGKPIAIRLKADRSAIKANKNDLAYINVEVVDEAGNVVPNMDDKLIKFQVSGNGSILGVANANPRDMSSFQKAEKKVYQGRNQIIISPWQKAGSIKITAQAEGLKSGSLTIKSK